MEDFLPICEGRTPKMIMNSITLQVFTSHALQSTSRINDNLSDLEQHVVDVAVSMFLDRIAADTVLCFAGSWSFPPMRHDEFHRRSALLSVSLYSSKNKNKQLETSNCCHFVLSLLVVPNLQTITVQVVHQHSGSSFWLCCLCASYLKTPMKQQ